MANNPRRFKRGTVLYSVHHLGGIHTHTVTSQRLSTITVQRPKGRIEKPDGSFEPLIQKQKIDAKEVDWGFKWYSDERKAVAQSISIMKVLMDYAKSLPYMIRDREELLAQLTNTLDKSEVQDLIRPHVY